MTLDEYKSTCEQVLTGLPLELCAGLDIYQAEKWGADRITLCRLHTLYEMAAIHETAANSEPMLYFNHWWSLPVREDLKYEVLNNVRAI
jgi:hypothetical protein